MQDFRKLIVWQKSVKLAGLVYRVTKGFPDDERYSLTSQMRRSAGSIASNIAEGCGRETRRDFARFLRVAYASACELETHAHVALEAGLGQRLELESIVESSEEVRRMIASLKRTVQARDR